LSKNTNQHRQLDKPDEFTPIQPLNPRHPVAGKNLSRTENLKAHTPDPEGSSQNLRKADSRPFIVSQQNKPANQFVQIQETKKPPLSCGSAVVDERVIDPPPNQCQRPQSEKFRNCGKIQPA
jgi:hypothetical protein